jgi:FAD/FMN-containing dehydrogenase
MFFLNTMDRSPEFVTAMHTIAEDRGYPDIGVYIQPVHQGASCHIEFNVPFDPANADDVDRMKQFYRRSSEEMLKHGAYYSRPYGIWSNMAFDRDVLSASVLRKIKRIFDPNNILNPGRLCFR